jgi:hypothetical protein
MGWRAIRISAKRSFNQLRMARIRTCRKTIMLPHRLHLDRQGRVETKRSTELPQIFFRSTGARKAKMPRYFFNIMEGHSQNLVRDIEGAQLSDAREARKEAVGLARDITRHDITRHGIHEPPQAWAVIVTDEHGDEVLTVPLSATRPRRSLAAFGPGNRCAKAESRFGRGTVVWLIGAAVLAIVAPATVARVRTAQQQPSYQIASAPAEGAMVAVRFAAQASMADVSKFLDDYAASFAGGPSQGNLYRVRVGDATLPPDELRTIAGRMAHEKVVVFAAAVQ